MNSKNTSLAARATACLTGLVLMLGLFVAAPHAYAASPADAAPVKRPATVKKVIKKVSVARLKNATTGTTKSLLASSSASLASAGCGTDDTATLCEDAEFYYIDTEYFDIVSQLMDNISLVVETLPSVALSGYCTIEVTNGRGVIGSILCSEFAETSLTPIGVGDNDRDALAAQVESLFGTYLGKVAFKNTKAYDKGQSWIGAEGELKKSFPNPAQRDYAIVEYSDGCMQFSYNDDSSLKWTSWPPVSVPCN